MYIVLLMNVIAQKYRLTKRLGKGQFGSVCEGVCMKTSKKYAIKLEKTDAPFSLLKHEAKVAQTLEHPNLNRCHGVVLRKTECYLILDLFKAPNLKQFIHNDRDGVIQRFSQLVEGVCLGLAHMHSKGWVHLDLKPDNILL